MPDSVFIGPLGSSSVDIPVSPADGGTGISSYTIGDMLYASDVTTLAKLAAVAVGQVLISNGVGVAPSWSANPKVTTLSLGGGQILDGATADVTKISRGSNAQSFSIYSEDIDSLNYSRLRVFTSPNYILNILAESAGTGTEQNLQIGTAKAQSIFFRTNGALRWELNLSGHLLANNDNSFDIGATASGRPKTINVGTSVISPVINATTGFQIGGVDGADFSGAITSLTIVKGLVTAAA